MTLAIPPGVAASLAQTRQNVALSTIKQQANTERQIADLIQQGADDASAAASGTRGQNLNITA